MIPYLIELRRQKSDIQKRIKTLEVLIENPVKVDDDFIRTYRELNDLRLNLETVKSRIHHKTKKRVIIKS